MFVKTKHGANRLAQQLARSGVEADAIHGNKSQNARTRALEQFKAGEMRVLVATDIAARGLDIEALPHVVNFDLPHVAEDYIHRIGRTGRAGSEGEAVSLVGHEDRPLLAAIERLMNRKVESRVIAGFEPGTPSSEPKQPSDNLRQQQPQRHGQRQQRGGQPQQRRPQQQGARPQQGQRPQQGPRPQQGQRPQRPQGPRPQQAQNPQHRPVQDSAYEDQIREARARMREEGENVPAQPQPSSQPRQQQPGGGEGRRRRGGRGGRSAGNGAGRGNGNGGGNNFRSPARSSRQQQWDPRRTEKAYREPADHSYQKPATSAHAVKVTHKPKRTLSGFVGALLGRKPEDSKND